MFLVNVLKSKFSFILLLLFHETNVCSGINWDIIHCAGDDFEDTPGSNAADAPLSRFRWLGVIQHKFYLAEDTQFAITQGVLIHPGYVLAPAEDIGRIPHEKFANTTEFILWGEGREKYALRLYDYVLHPDYTSSFTAATVAVLQLERWVAGHQPAPVDPICLPVKGMGTFDNLFVIKLNDRKGEINKEIFKVDYVQNYECSEFYYRAQLSYEKMAPQYPLCASVAPDIPGNPVPPCLWESGALLVARLNQAYWTLLGFGVRGPGCGAPARFVGMHKMMEWIDDTITKRPFEDLPVESNAFFLRQLSPYQIKMYKMDVYVPTEYGQCERAKVNGRGSVQFKDATEINMNKSFGTGFFFVAVWSISQFTCAIVKFETITRSFTGLWVEHHCHRDNSGPAFGMTRGLDERRFECFVYFKTSAFVEFRYTFSFKSFVEMTLYGIPMRQLNLNPWLPERSTDEWYPTDEIFEWGLFVPYYWSKWQ